MADDIECSKTVVDGELSQQPRTWYGIGNRGACSFMLAWRQEKARAVETRLWQKEADKKDRVVIEPGVPSGETRRFRVALANS